MPLWLDASHHQINFTRKRPAPGVNGRPTATGKFTRNCPTDLARNVIQDAISRHADGLVGRWREAVQQFAGLGCAIARA
jgi:hypothetical protein